MLNKKKLAENKQILVAPNEGMERMRAGREKSDKRMDERVAGWKDGKKEEGQ